VTDYKMTSRSSVRQTPVDTGILSKRLNVSSKLNSFTVQFFMTKPSSEPIS